MVYKSSFLNDNIPRFFNNIGSDKKCSNEVYLHLQPCGYNWHPVLLVGIIKESFLNNVKLDSFKSRWNSMQDRFKAQFFPHVKGDELKQIFLQNEWHLPIEVCILSPILNTLKIIFQIETSYLEVSQVKSIFINLHIFK